MLLMYEQIVKIIENCLRDSTFSQVNQRLSQTRNLINILNRILPVFPNTRDHANKIVSVLTKRVPDSEAGKCKTSLDFLAQSYKTSIGKMSKTSLPEINISGRLMVTSDLDGSTRKDRKPKGGQNTNGGIDLLYVRQLWRRCQQR